MNDKVSLIQWHRFGDNKPKNGAWIMFFEGVRVYTGEYTEGNTHHVYLGAADYAHFKAHTLWAYSPLIENNVGES